MNWKGWKALSLWKTFGGKSHGRPTGNTGQLCLALAYVLVWETQFSCRYWACPVVYWGPCPAAGPSFAHQSPCAWGTEKRSSLALWTGLGLWGRWGCSEAMGSCRSDVLGRLWVEPCCSCCPGGCGPSSEGLWVMKCLWPAHRSSS